MQKTEQTPRVTILGQGGQQVSTPPQTPNAINVFMSGPFVESFKKSLAKAGLQLAGPMPEQMGGSDSGAPTYVITVRDDMKRRNGL
jgi:hypothetical protein